MRAKASTLCLSSLVAVTAGCGLFDTAQDLSHAAAMFRCGPADGPTTVIVLAHEPIESAELPFPHVIIVIAEPVSALPGRIWDITMDTAPGVWYAVRPGRMQSAISGRVSVTSVDSTNRVDGAVDLQFPARTVATAFRAPWIESRVLCP